MRVFYFQKMQFEGKQGTPKPRARHKVKIDFLDFNLRYHWRQNSNNPAPADRHGADRKTAGFYVNFCGRLNLEYFYVC